MTPVLTHKTQRMLIFYLPLMLHISLRLPHPKDNRGPLIFNDVRSYGFGTTIAEKRVYLRSTNLMVKYQFLDVLQTLKKYSLGPPYVQ